MPSADRCILLLADGARADVFESLLADGSLPNIQKHIVDRGSYARSVTAFASTSGPAYIPFLTGAFPGTANVPGIRWMDKRLVASKPVWNRNRYRSYCGLQSRFLTRDIESKFVSLFDHANSSVNVFGPITRGLRKGENRRPITKLLLWMRSHYDAGYKRVDAFAARLVEAALAQPFQMLFAIFPGIDGLSHHSSPHDKAVLDQYEAIDRCVGRVADKLHQSGAYESTAIGICSDHGLTETKRHLNLARTLSEIVGGRVSEYPFMWKPWTRASVQVSGNSMAHVYLNDISTVDHVVESLIAIDGIDVVLSSCEGGVSIRSMRGSAVASELDGEFCYVVDGTDPFGFDALPTSLTLEEALQLTSDTKYPDAIVQSVQLFRSRRCGDVVVTARNGVDLRGKWERPEHHSSHGSLHVDHMRTPFAFSLPLTERVMRTADTYPTILEALGKSWVETGDCRSRLAAVSSQLESSRRVPVPLLQDHPHQ